MEAGKTEPKLFREDMNEKIIQCLKENGTFFDGFKIDQEPRTETNDLLDSYFKYMNVNADHWHLPVEDRVDMAADHMLDYFEGSDEERLFYREVLAYVIKARGTTAVDMKVKQAEKLAELLSEDSGLFFNAFSEVMHKLEKVDQIHKRYMDDITQGSFPDLTVRFRWSEANLINPITNQAFKNAQSVEKALKNRFHFTNLEAFNVEEEVYLKDHPQIAELNRYQCKTRLYLHPADTVWEVPYAKRYLSIKKPEEYGFSKRVEMASLYLAMETGLSFEPQNHAAYLQGWVQVLKSDKNEFFRAARDAENITKYLLDFALEKTLQQEQPEQKKVWAVKDSVNEKVMEETAALLTEVCQCQAVMCKGENKSIAFTPSVKGKNYQVTVFNEEGKPKVQQQFDSVREAVKYLHALGARAETICDRVIDEPKPEQKRLSAILLESVPKIKPTLSKLYKLRFKELLEQDLPYRKIDLEVAKSLLEEGHDKARVQSTITKFSPQAVIDRELKYANKIIQEVAPGIDKKVGKAMGL